MIRVLRAADRVAVPWKNGGGVTREVAIGPERSGFDDFDWRISIADVRDAGPFSRFQNIDRTLMILGGRLSLAFADRTVALDANSAPFAFGGEDPCSGTPLDGAVTDLNVMARRGRCRARVSRIVGETALADSGQCILVASSATDIQVDRQFFSLAAQDALAISGGEKQLSASHAAFLIVLG